MAEKRVTLVVVRHGQATHNLPDSEPARALVYSPAGDLDTLLTPLGRQQVNKVAWRLADSVFHLAVTSPLQRARNTGLAILAAGSGGLQLHEWDCLRERRWGFLEGERIVRRAQQCVEAAVADRVQLTWAPPAGAGARGESVVELQERVRLFLAGLQEVVAGLEQEEVSVLVAGHAGWMKELALLLAGEVRTNAAHTAVDQYSLLLGPGGLREAIVILTGCVSHLG
jgi:broad specificity phosphatase PhoE